MRWAIVVLGVGVLLTMVGCGSRNDERITRPCNADDFTLQRLDWNGATGSLIGSMTFLRNPGHECRLDSTVRARILWSSGLLAVPVRLVDRLPGDSMAPATPSAQRMAIRIQWSNWCGWGLAPKAPGALRLSISFAHGGYVEVPVTDHPRCESRKELSRALSTRFLAI